MSALSLHTKNNPFPAAGIAFPVLPGAVACNALKGKPDKSRQTSTKPDTFSRISTPSTCPVYAWGARKTRQNRTKPDTFSRISMHHRTKPDRTGHIYKI